MLQKAAPAARLLAAILLLQLALWPAKGSLLVDKQSLHSRTRHRIHHHHRHLHHDQLRPEGASWPADGHRGRQASAQLAGSDDNEIVAGQTELLSLFQHHATTTTSTTNHRNRQVPQQTLPAIVVSSSDNSYVSASPTTTTTTTDDDHQHQHHHNHRHPHLHGRDQRENEIGEPDEEEEEEAEGPAGEQVGRQAARPHIWALYESKLGTIIKTRESIARGATFINYTIVTSLKACLVECWITDSCDTAIYQETPVDFRNHLPYFGEQATRTDLLSSRRARQHDVHLAQLQRAGSSKLAALSQHHAGFFICYLFECAKQDGYKCQFSPHVHYVSASKRPLVVEPDDEVELDRPDEDDDDDGEETAAAAEDDDLEEEDEEEEEEEEELDEEDEELQQDEGEGARQVNPRGRSTGVASGAGRLNSATETRSSTEMVSTSKRPFTNHRRPSASQPAPHFSRIIAAHPNQQALAGRWHDSRIASIKVDGQEEQYGQGGVNSAIIAIMIGIAATGMLIVIVGHKMKSIRRRMAQKGRRRSLVPDTNFLINTMPISSSLFETPTAATASNQSKLALNLDTCSS